MEKEARDMTINVHWGSRLESMADDLLDQLTTRRVTDPTQVLAKRDCIVAPNRIQQAWLQQRFLYDMPHSARHPHVLMNCDFPPLNPFVNEWLFRMDHPQPDTDRPDPEKHPFSVKSMRWRIFDILYRAQPDGDLSPLKRYVQATTRGANDPRKCFKLAGRLAKLMDEYVTYRPGMMRTWGEGREKNPRDDDTRWQSTLWRALVDNHPERTLLDAFLRMGTDLKNSGIGALYSRIFVFAPSMLPGVYLAFFRALGEILPVDFYLLNPARGDWFEHDSPRDQLRGLDRPDDRWEATDTLHPLLSAYARGARDAVAGAIDLTEGQAGGGEREETRNFAGGENTTHVLGRLQRSIIDNTASADAQTAPADGSIQLHLCHGKMREVEILRDQILRCFEDFKGLQPRHVQVQVIDMADYAPYIEAVFGTQPVQGRSAIPFVIADKMTAGESPVAEAFRLLLALAESRFTALELIDLLRCESVARKFGVEPDDVDTLVAWMKQAGIRWGRDRTHRKQMSNADFDARTSWRYGLDRLLLGYALGQDHNAGAGWNVIPCDCVEGDGAVLLGRFARFHEMATAFAEFGTTPHTVNAWADRLDRLVDDFFLNDNETYLDIATVKNALRLLRTSITAAGLEQMETPGLVIREFLEGHLAETTGGTDLNRNAVLFNALRPGSSVPRRVQCVLGMGDNLFPRAENRPAYDQLQKTRKMGDRSRTIEDRMAFLEVLLNARDRLLISYPAFSEEDNTPSCESIVVRELLEYLDMAFGRHSYTQIRHRLHAFHPAYFEPETKRHGGLFSYSVSDCEAAKALQRQHKTPDGQQQAAPPPPTPPPIVELHDLIAFFKNPARFFYEKILGVHLEPKGEAALDDTEPFEPDAWDMYAIHEQIVAAVVTAGSAAAPDMSLCDKLMANGMTPLGAAGEAWFRKEWENISSLIDQDWDGLGPIRPLLQARQRADPQALVATVSLGDGKFVQVRGTVRITPTNDLILFRCANPKAKMRLEAWLTHLLARAAGQSVRSVLVQGKKEKDIEAFVTEDIPEDALRPYLEIYRDGHAVIPPFVPEAALAYLEAKNKNRDKKPGKDHAAPSPEKVAEAMCEAARKKWFSSGDIASREGEADPHFHRAFGDEGPFKDWAAFGTWAEKIMGTMLIRQTSLKPKRGTS